MTQGNKLMTPQLPLENGQGVATYIGVTGSIPLGVGNEIIYLASYCEFNILERLIDPLLNKDDHVENNSASFWIYTIDMLQKYEAGEEIYSKATHKEINGDLEMTSKMFKQLYDSMLDTDVGDV